MIKTVNIKTNHERTSSEHLSLKLVMHDNSEGTSRLAEGGAQTSQTKKRFKLGHGSCHLPAELDSADKTQMNHSMHAMMTCKNEKTK